MIRWFGISKTFRWGSACASGIEQLFRKKRRRRRLEGWRRNCWTGDWGDFRFLLVFCSWFVLGIQISYHYLSFTNYHLCVSLHYVHIYNCLSTVIGREKTWPLFAERRTLPPPASPSPTTAGRRSNSLLGREASTTSSSRPSSVVHSSLR